MKKMFSFFKKKDEGTTLIELVVTIAITGLVMLGLTNLVTGVVTFVFSTSASAGNIESAAFITQNALSQLEGAQPLGACATDATTSTGNLGVVATGQSQTSYSFTTPYSSCAQYATFASPYYSYTPNGVCFYSYTYAQTSTSKAPKLECLYQDTTANKLYLTSWSPSPNSTYTTCNPSSCWTVANGVAPPVVGSAPSSYVSCSSANSNCITYDLGLLVRSSAALTKQGVAPALFSYTGSSGSVLSSSGTLPTQPVVTKVDIYAEDDSASSWIGPKKYQISLYISPKGSNLNAYAWNNQTS